MGRECRRVPANWSHPIDYARGTDHRGFKRPPGLKPLDRFDYFEEGDDPADFMPNWSPT